MGEFKAECRGPNCGKPVVMRPMNGQPGAKPHPYDPATRCPRCKGAKVIHQQQFSLMAGEPTRTDQPCPKSKGEGVVWVSHFQTCVDRAMFTRRANANA